MAWWEVMFSLLITTYLMLFIHYKNVFCNFIPLKFFKIYKFFQTFAALKQNYALNLKS